MNIVIVGGGTAGWITALYANYVFPEHDITVIESKDIGILGAGEGTVPEIKNFFSILEIPLHEMIIETKTSIKNGIKFTNWSGIGEHYFHPFCDPAAITKTNFPFNFYKDSSIDPKFLFSLMNNEHFDKYSLSAQNSYKNKTPFVFKGSNIGMSNFEEVFDWSIHFDAKLLAEYLKKIALGRGIYHFFDNVNDVKLNENGFVYKLILNNNNSMNVDFLFDCTGFKRLFMKEIFNIPWVSYSKHLPANRAMPFFLNIDEKIPPYTESIAMKYGWMWKIALQHRYGCGYVYNNNYISDDEAKIEIEEYLGHTVEVPKHFSFSPGSFEKIWVKNVMSVGLASGFVEPLEATSIWQIVKDLRRFMTSKENIFCKNKKNIDFVNEKHLEDSQEIVDFLYLHYVTKRSDTKFWSNFTKENEMPEGVKHILKKFEKGVPQLDDFEKNTLFTYPSILSVVYGNKFIYLNKDNSYLSKDQIRYCLETKNKIKEIENKFLDVKDFIKMI